MERPRGGGYCRQWLGDSENCPLAAEASDREVGQPKLLIGWNKGTPPGPTTHSLELGNFPLCAKRPRIGGSAIGAVVSAETNSGLEEI